MNAGHLIIRNRTALASQEGWIHVVPKGELPNREAGIVQVLDDAALDAIMLGIAKDKERLGNRWPGVYAGEEHFIYNDEKSSAAFAWFKDFEKREDGIWAKADGLTDLGEAAVKNRRFKYTSFVTDQKDTKKIEGNRVRILGVETIGFTNQANGRELLTPITNRSEEFRRGLELSADSKNNNDRKTKTMKTVLVELELSADAAEESALAAVRKLKNRATTAEGQVVPLTLRVTELETANTTLLSEQIDADLAAAGIKDEKIINRHKPLLSDPKHFANREERVAFIQDLAPQGQPVKGQTKLQNRDTRPPQGGKTADADGRAESAKATKIMNRASELQKQVPSMTLATAVTMAQNEVENAS